MTRDAGGAWTEVSRTRAFGREFQAWRIAFSNFVPLVCLAHERCLWEEAGRFDESFDLYEDWEFLVRASRKVAFAHVPRTTALYRLRDDASNATLAIPWGSPASEAARLAVYRRHWDLHTPEAEMALVDAHESEITAALSREREAFEAATRLQSESEADRARWRAESAEKDGRIAAMEAAVEEHRREWEASAAREVNLALEKDAQAARAERLQAIVDQMTSSLAWRLFTPWWKLKAALERRRGGDAG